MALQFILGGSASGKSYNLYSKILQQAAAEPEGKFFVIVPEQFTMQTQRDLVMLSEKKGISNIDVLSFMRLAYKVFGDVGVPERIALEDTGKNMIIRKLLTDNEANLKYYGSSGKKQGFVEELKSLLTEFYQYSVGTDALEKAIKGLDTRQTVLRRKLEDVGVIYKAFNTYKKDRYITAEEILEVLCDVLDKDELIKDSVICFDGFTGFTPSQYNVLRILMHMAKDIVITVTIPENEALDNNNEEFKLFHLSKKTISKITKIANDEGYPVAKFFYTNRKPANAAIAFIEEQIFRYPQKTFEGETEGVKVIEASGPKQEVNYIQTEILHLIRDEGYRYRDIAVITGDMATYGELLEQAFTKNDIVSFIDNKKNILKNPLVEFIRAAVAVVDEDFAYEPVMRYLRSGFSSISPDEADVFENYIIKKGIRGYRRYARAWAKNSAITDSDFVDGKLTEVPEDAKKKKTQKELQDEAIRISADKVRKVIYEEFGSLRTAFKEDKTADGMAKSVYEFLIRHKAAEKILDMQDSFAKQGEILLEKEYAQVYRLVLGVFEKMVELMPGEKLTVEEFVKIVEAGFSEEQVGLIPPGMDCLVVGDLNRTRIKDIKALFVLGVNDGIIPAAGGKSGILSDADKEVLSGLEIELAPTLKQKQFTEQFYLYMNLTKPSERLYLSYSLTALAGATLRKSYLIGRICKMFPGIKVVSAKANGDEEIETKIRRDGGLSAIRDALTGREDNFASELLNYYMNHDEEACEYNAMISGYSDKGFTSKLSQNAAEKLFDEIKGSVSRLEKYAECEFAHFLAYGLRLSERDEYEIGAPELGSLFHSIISEYTDRVLKEEEGFRGITEERCIELVNEIALSRIESFGDGIFASTKRYAGMAERVIRFSERTAKEITEQIKQGNFMPFETEVPFDMDGIRGVIDRVDLCDTEGSRLIRIIDYKSGNRDFDICRFYYGLTLQLALYMRSALKDKKYDADGLELKPAGMFYYTFKDPIFSEDKLDKRDEEFAMKGLMLDEPETLVAMDNGFAGTSDAESSSEESSTGALVAGYKSAIVPAKISGKGVLSGDVVPMSIFKEITDIAESKSAELLGNIKQGSIAVKPYKLDKDNACQYCSFRSICGFENGDKYSYKRLKKFDFDSLPEGFLSSAESGEEEENG